MSTNDPKADVGIAFVLSPCRVNEAETRPTLVTSAASRKNDKI